MFLVSFFIKYTVLGFRYTTPGGR
uniref:Uncharacterized protein n=1 Tax=Rhizophora mucronata TaxID=61149 RepID=A0A2P2P1Y8_RHIMU